MYCVYEVYTWDDVDYKKIAEFETEKAAETEMERLQKERAKIFKPSKTMPVDAISYKVMSDLQYDLLMKN